MTKATTPITRLAVPPGRWKVAEELAVEIRRLHDAARAAHLGTLAYLLGLALDEAEKQSKRQPT